MWSRIDVKRSLFLRQRTVHLILSKGGILFISVCFELKIHVSFTCGVYENRCVV